MNNINKKCDIDFNSNKFKKDVIKATEDSGKAQSELVEKADKLEELTKAIQEAVPEIMELELGCKIDIEKESIDWAKIVIFIGCNIRNGLNYFMEKDGSIFYTRGLQEDYKILGRDITLEDCLIAMSKELLESCIDIRWSATYIILIDNRLDNIGGDDRCIWRLNTPLHQQEQETIDFLWDLICKE